jgi:hypothetical protein
MKAGIVVLSWNGGERTLACIDSVLAQEYPDKFLVLVDNNSQPEQRELLRGRYAADPAVHFCFLDENRGYAGGNNAGIDVALAAGAEVVVIVTQDATLASGALAAMVAAAGEAGVGIVGPAVVDARDARRVWSVGERIGIPWLCVPRTLLRYRRARREPYDVGGVLGCVMLLTRRCAESTGGFDEGFFAYYEEVDLCLRARAHGFRIVCAPQALAAHDGMRGFVAGFTELSAELKARNLMRLMRRWAGPADWVLLVPTYFLLLAASMAVYALRGRLDIVAALACGVVAGLQGRGGVPGK